MKKKKSSNQRKGPILVFCIPLDLRIDRIPPLSIPSLLPIPRGTGTHGRVVVIWPRGRETAVPGVGAPVGTTVGDGVGTKCVKRDNRKGWEKKS